MKKYIMLGNPTSRSGASVLVEHFNEYSDAICYILDNKLENWCWYEVLEVGDIDIISKRYNYNKAYDQSVWKKPELTPDQIEEAAASVMTIKVDDLNFNYKYNVSEQEQILKLNNGKTIVVFIKNVVNKNKKQFLVVLEDQVVNEYIVEEDYSIRPATLVDTLEMI